MYEAAVNHPNPNAILEDGDDLHNAHALWGLEDNVVMFAVEPQW